MNRLKSARNCQNLRNYRQFVRVSTPFAQNLSKNVKQCSFRPSSQKVPSKSDNEKILEKPNTEKLVDEKIIDETVKKLKNEKDEKQVEKRKVFTKVALTFFATFLLFLAYQNQKRIQKQMKAKNVLARPEMKADIGGPWQMTDHNGNKLSDEDFKGKWLIYYFGFTHCPDICPEELEKIATLVKALRKDKKTANIVPIFVTIDPERDDIPAVKQYISKFSDDYIGLTGTVDECAKMAKTFRIFYSKGDADKLGNYQVDHSIVSYLFDPNGEFADFFHKRDTVGNRIKKCTSYIKNFKQ